MCREYRILNTADRKITYESGSLCDDRLQQGWYRFEGDAGARIPTTCVPKNRCGTSFPGWLNGNHPTVADGDVRRQVCFHKNSECCHHGYNNIRVKNCTSYYIYKLLPTAGCNERYCGTDWPWHQINSLLGNSCLKYVTWCDITMNYEISISTKAQT